MQPPEAQQRYTPVQLAARAVQEGEALCSPVARMTVSASTAFASVHTKKGLLERSTFVTVSE